MTKKDYVIIVLALAFLVTLIALVALVWANERSGIEYQQERSLDVEEQSTANENNASEGQRVGNDADRPSSKTLTCEEKLREQTEANNQKYQKGSVLIAFSDSVTYDEAQNIIREYDLEYSDDEGVESSFAVSHWITAYVEKGEEFAWICRLNEDVHIKHVGLNAIFELHE